MTWKPRGTHMTALITLRNVHKPAAISLFLCLMLVPVLAFAQGEGSISGMITDATGGAIPGTSVTVKNLETGAARTTVVGDDGRYDVPLLPVARYEVTAEIRGFQPSKRQVTLVVGARAVVDFTLKVEDLQEAVQVEEALGEVT